MKRLITIFAAIIGSCLLAQAGTDYISILLSERLQKRITADYSFSIDKEGTIISLNGTASVQDDNFYIKGNGMEIFCDKTGFYIVDREAKEVCIESIKTIDEYISANAGGVRDFKLFNIHKEEKSEDLSAFHFDPASLGSGWVITDLR